MFRLKVAHDEIEVTSSQYVKEEEEIKLLTTPCGKICLTFRVLLYHKQFM